LSKANEINVFSGEKPRRIAVVDCQFAGISGDMLVGALLDLGANIKKTVRSMESVKDYVKGCDRLQVTVTEVTRHGLRAKRVEVKAVEKFEYRTGIELTDAISKCLMELKLSKAACNFATNTLETIIKAEAKVHGENLEEVHLHEAGSADTLADIIGTATALEDLGIFRETKVYSMPVAVGGGLFKFSHGIIPSPTPATIEILRSKHFMMLGGPVEAELATPTGVALLVNLADTATQTYPPMKPKAIGYGAGAKDFNETPNILRITVGEPLEHGFLSDEIYVLETNLDDVTGEVVGHTMDRLLREGARDVSIIPMFTKKNRPGQILKIITDRQNVEHLSQIVVEETGTLGVRMYPCKRYILTRETIPVEVEIEGKRETVNVKVSKELGGKAVQVKPEYVDVKKLADKTGKPLRIIIDLVVKKAREVHGKP